MINNLTPKNKMNRHEIREAKKYLRIENSKQTDILTEVSKENWPKVPNEHTKPLKVFRSKKYVVQVFFEEVLRLSINRTMIDSNGKWLEDITWDELQEIKRKCGYGDRSAVEIFPADKDIVNVANMRHLWIVNFRFWWKG